MRKYIRVLSLQQAFHSDNEELGIVAPQDPPRELMGQLLSSTFLPNLQNVQLADIALSTSAIFTERPSETGCLDSFAKPILRYLKIDMGTRTAKDTLIVKPSDRVLDLLSIFGDVGRLSLSNIILTAFYDKLELSGAPKPPSLSIRGCDVDSTDAALRFLGPKLQHLVIFPQDPADWHTHA
ncbi:hypothetical protein EUX98_g1316 [Antrodiella citrinella]|uniref:Uncharacterized protein n=1 Tax=Antrodiella citrinella TaxID=2447956 RepID=A0A4S4N390_9APHY|nr:hypothetical protein EUX98_g1316 [Antrodiella citrinella]